jgi:hypothetical protein
MKIRTIRTITFINEVEFSDEIYPGMSLAEAKEYEEGLEVGDVVDLLTISKHKMTATATIVNE